MVRRKRLIFVAVSGAVMAVFGHVAAVVTPEITPPAAMPTPRSEKLWTFGFVGDTQLGGAIVGQIFARMQAAGVEFALHLGDMVDEPACDAEWDELLHTAARHRIRLLPVVGNHDRRLDYADRGEIRFRQYFPALPQTFYHFRHRGVNFLMLNSERSLWAASEQGRFVRWQLEHHPGTTIVCLHRPVFTCGRRDLVQQYMRRYALHGSLVGSDTVAVLAGHHHYYDRTQPLDGITYVVSGGGSVKLHEQETPDGRTAVFQSGCNHYGLVDVYEDRLEVRVLDLEDKELDRFALALRPSRHRLGGYHNRPGTELPPLDELPDYAPGRLEAFTTAARALPRPW